VTEGGEKNADAEAPESPETSAASAADKGKGGNEAKGEKQEPKAGATLDGDPRSAPDTGRPVVLLLSGPNLNLLGEREPEVYGTERLEQHVQHAEGAADDYGLAFEHFQSNHEGELVEAVQRARGHAAAIVINAGALTHYAWALHDALSAYDGYIVELHLSNPNAREPWRQTSVIAPVAHGTISGFGGLGYELAIEAVARLLG
jgi:3-dehydroquinate dehydratase-2